MRLTCMVCRELLVPSDEVSVAPCGHYLHYTCWIEWLERAKNCPQCRAKTQEKQLVKLFFNVADGETGDQDVSTLNNKIDSLTFELRCKNKDVENSKALIEKTQKQNKGLRDEIIKYKDQVDAANVTCARLNEKMRYLQRQNKEVEDAKAECERLRTQTDRLKNLDTVIRGSTSEVKNLVETTPCTPEGLRNLALFCGSLKTVLEDAKEKRKHAVESYEAQKADIFKFKEEIRALRGELEIVKCTNKDLSDDVKYLEEEKQSLGKKISELEAAICSPSAGSAANKALKRLIAESPVPALKRTSDDIDDSDVFEDQNTPILTAAWRSYKLNKATTSKPSISQELDVSPLFGIKPKVVREVMLKRPPASSSISIFSNRLLNSKIPQTRNTSVYSEGYDGMGGHSKIDEFPVPVQGASKKLKRSPSIVRKKLSAPAGVPKLTQFDGFIDLT